MSELFLKLLNMSLTASWIALGVMAARLLLKKAPKAITVALWALVGIRLVLPFSFESVLSLLPATKPVPEDITMMPVPQIQSGIPIVNNTINPILSENFAPNPVTSANPLQILTALAAQVWLLGVIAMVVYALVSYFRLRLQVREAARIGGKVFECDRVPSPFILGVFRPRIYLPSGMDGEDRSYVIAHERAHLQRRDHLWKPIGYALLTVYWFNPILWLAYVLLCRDIELACDEKVIRELGEESKKPYSQALISCSAQKRRIAACPLAFGEGSVKGRIKSVLNYKKPAFWVIIAALIVCAVLAVCFLADPPGEDLPVTTHKNIVATSGGSEVNLISLPQEAQLEDFPEAVNWLTINKNPEDYTPFTLLVDGNVRFGSYTVYDAETNEVLPYFLPSGLEPSTYLFQNATPGRKYIVQIKLYDDVDSQILAFGAILPEESQAEEPFYTSGTVLFYKESTPEFDTPEIVSYGFFSAYEMKSLLQILEDTECTQWTDHSGSDIVFRFDGKFYHNGWIYFSYEQNTVYYDHYYGKLDAELKGWLQTLQSVATPYEGSIPNDPARDDAISQAILQQYQPKNPDEVYCAESFVLLGEEKNKDMLTAYIVASHVAYRLNHFSDRVENVAPAKLTFRIENGSYVLQEYTPVDMANFDAQVEMLFPAEIAQKINAENIKDYTLRLKEACATRYVTATGGSSNVLTQYWEYYELDPSNGLTVCVWQLGDGVYNWGLLPGLEDPDPLDLIHLKGATLKEIQYIVTAHMEQYGLTKDQIRVVPVRMPWSSYYYEIDKAYEAQMERLFWSDILESEAADLSTIRSTFTMDTNRNDIPEEWQLRKGVSTGNETPDVVIAVYEEGELLYYNRFENYGHLENWTFQQGERGALYLYTDDGGVEERVAVRLWAGSIRLVKEDGEFLNYVGEQGIYASTAVTGNVQLENTVDDWGMSMQVVYLADGDVTIVLRRQAFAGQEDVPTISTPQIYELEIYYDNGYIPYAQYVRKVLGQNYAEPAWDDLLHTIEPDGVLRQQAHLKSTWGDLPAGMYRISKKVTKTGSDNIQSTRIYAATFTLTETAQNQLNNSGEGFREWMDDFIERSKATDGQYRCDPNEDPVAAVRSYIEKEKDAEYTISISFGKGEVDPEETRRVVAMYDGSQLAASNCWSSAWIAEHFTVVYAEYDAAFDHEKTFLPDGARAQHFYLIRDPDSMLWYIWDAAASTER